jgi:hypothetical protein
MQKDEVPEERRDALYRTVQDAARQATRCGRGPKKGPRKPGQHWWRCALKGLKYMYLSKSA